MKGLSKKFQDAIDELGELYSTDKNRANAISSAVGQALIHVDKHNTNEFRPAHLASVGWPADPNPTTAEKSK